MHKKKLPYYMIVPLALVFGFQFLIYFGSKTINQNLYHHDFTTPLDRSVPFLPGFVWIYVLAYVQWGLMPLVIAYFIGKKRGYQTLALIFSGLVVSFLFFIFLPTTIVRPDVVGEGLTYDLLRFIYQSDTPSNNLLPSLHVFLSWVCFVAVRKKGVSKWLIWSQAIMGILVLISTQVLKQHYYIDFVLAIVIAEVLGYFIFRTEKEMFYERFFDKVNLKLKISISEGNINEI